MIQTKANPALIDWENRPVKRNNDSFLDNCMTALLHGVEPSLNILSLPGGKWCWEKGLMQRNPQKNFSFTGVEQDPAVRDQCLLTAVEHPSLYVSEYRKLQQHLDNTDDCYHAVYFDFMGEPTENKLKCVETLASNWLLYDDSWILLTFALSNRGLSRSSHTDSLFRVAEATHPTLHVNLLDARDQQRQAGLMKSSNVQTVAKAIPSLIHGDLQKWGYEVTEANVRIYYNDHACPKYYPEASICLRVRHNW
jgi:hypothetical protein